MQIMLSTIRVLCSRFRLISQLAAGSKFACGRNKHSWGLGNRERETNRQTERTSLEVKVDRQTDRENIPRSQSSASCLRLCQNVRHNYTHTQKLSDLLRQCTDVQASVNCFHEICTAARLIFTSLPPCNLHSLSSPRTPHRLDDTWETYLMTVKRRTNTCFARKVTYVWNNLGSGVIELMPRTR